MDLPVVLLSLLPSSHGHTQAPHLLQFSLKGLRPPTATETRLSGEGNTCSLAPLSCPRWLWSLLPCGGGGKQYSLPGCHRGHKVALLGVNPSADPGRTRSGIWIVLAPASVTGHGVNCPCHNGSMQQKGLLWPYRVRGSHPPWAGESTRPPGAPHIAPLSELLLFSHLQPGPFFPLAL